MTQSIPTQSTQSRLTAHLTHEQICDLLLSEPIGNHLDANAAETAPHTLIKSTIQSAAHRQYRDHLDACLICASELDLLRRTTSAFHVSAIAVADRELARHSLPSHFASLYTPRSHRFASPTLFWAATAMLFAAVLPLGLISTRHNSLSHESNNTIASTSSTESTTTQAERDAALLNSIDQDLSAAVPSPLSPLATPSDSTQTTPSETEN